VAVNSGDLLDAVHRHEAVASRTLEGARNALSAPLRDFQGWYDHTAIKALAELLAGLLRGFESNAARNADSYMAEAVSIVTGKRFQPTGVRRTQLGRHNVANDAVLGRIANAYRYQQGQVDRDMIAAGRSGKVLNSMEPRDAAFERLNKIVQTNLQMAQRSQMLTTMAGSQGVIGYRRIIHPELAGEGTCGLCIAAADRHYHKGELLPIHPGCHCTVLPETRSYDPHSINEDDFSKIYTDAGGTSAEQLRATRYRIDQHGEIGPVIRPEDEPIRTKREAVGAKRKTGAAPLKNTDEQVATLVNRRDQILDEYHKIVQDISNGDKYDDEWGPTLDRMHSRVDNLNKQIDELRGDKPELREQDMFVPPAPDAHLTPKLGDLPKINGSHDLRSDVIQANPDYAPGNEYSVNCVHAVQAWEMRRRGYDVVATPLPGDMIRQQGRSAQAALNGAWKPPRKFTSTSAVGAGNIANSWPDGARGFVIVNWKTGGSHIFAVEKTPAGAIFVDPQRGLRILASDYTSRAVPTIQIVRVDDLEPTDSIHAFVRTADNAEATLSRQRVADKSYAGHFSPGDLRSEAE
jgi:hypothetical protein